MSDPAPFSPESTAVAVLGTGTMGAGMARNLLAAGFDVTVWNRTESRAEPLADDGATVAQSVAAAVGDADVVVSMLFDEPALTSVVEEALPHLRDDVVWVQSGTIGPDGTARVGDLLAGRAMLVDAPVLGTKKPAEDGTLVVLASADPAVLQRLSPVFDAVGSRVVVAGDVPGPASSLKLACNAWVATMMAGIGQSLAIADSLGVDPRLFLEAVGGGAMDAPYLHLKADAILSESFEPSFTVDGVSKDVGLMLEATDGEVSADLLEAVAALFARASAAGHGDDDMAAVATVFAKPTTPA